MQKAEVVFDALHSLGTRKLPLQRVYRQLFNPLIYPEPENRVPTPLIEELKTQRFRWGQDTTRDRLVKTALGRILTWYGSGRDGKYVHGLRFGTGIHSALKTAKAIAQNARWIGIWNLRELPGLGACRIDSILEKKVEDKRFKDLLRHYFRNCPQPAEGPRNLFSQSFFPEGLHGICQHFGLQELDLHLASLAATSSAPRRANRIRPQTSLRYVRYMNWLMAAGNGSEEEAESWSKEISTLALAFTEGLEHSFAGMQEVGQFQSSKSFLGYGLTVTDAGKVSLRLTEEQIAKLRKPFQMHGKPASRGERTPMPDKVICDLYSQEFSAIDQFYALAENRRALVSLQRTLHSSMMRTLAQKHKCRVSEVSRRTGMPGTGKGPLQRVDKTKFQVKWIEDVRWNDPERTLVGEPCAVKVARTVRREAQ